jgi:hypothetical protein
VSHDPAPGRPFNDDAEADALWFGVDAIYSVDLPAWWCRLTSPVALSWRRQASVLVALALAGFILGAIVGARVLA